MAEPIDSNGQADVARIGALVERARRLLRLSWVTTGAALTLGLLLAATLATGVADLLVPLPVALRVAAFVLVVVPTALAFLAGIARPLVRRLSANQVARRIESQIPNIQSRLVTSLDLARSQSQSRLSAAFFARLIAETVDRIKGFRPGSIVDRRNLRRSGVFVAGAATLFVLALLILSDRLPTAMARVFSPLADIPPASGVFYTAHPGDTSVLKGDDVTIAAIIERGDPGELRLEYRESGGRWLHYPMQRIRPDRFEFTVAGLEASIEYRLVGGRTWTRRHTIEVVERPAITDMHAVVRYPEYMKLPEPKVGPPQTGDAAGPVGSDVEVIVAAEGDVATGEIQVLTPVTKMRKIAERRERVWFEGTLPDGAKVDGPWQWDYSLKFRAAHTQPAGGGPQHHAFHSTTVGFEVQPGQHLFTYVFVVPGQVPEEIVLGWHDGTNWEHRVYWGADKIQAGSPDSPSRFRAGELPPAGDWVLLDVPAKAVGLDGKRVHGMSFTIFGGQCKWNRAGTIDPAEIPERSFIVERTFAMQPAPAAQQATNTPDAPRSTGRQVNSPSAWSGHITLNRDMLYRVELKNRIGYANKAMKESKLTAIPDNPPQVTLERPGVDIVLSEPQKVPLVVRAFDDFGLADVALAVQKGDSGGFVGSPIRVFDEPARSDSILAALDLAPHQLKPGEHVRYRVQARDRKGQIAQTQEFVVRIAADANAADKQLAAIGQQHDSFQEKLVKLIAEQSKVTEAVAQMAGKERPAERPEADTTKQSPPRPAPEGSPKVDPAKVAPNPLARPTDPAAAAEFDKKMAELRQALAQLGGQQDANVQLGSQLQSELDRAATQLAASRLVPEELANQMRMAEQAFQQLALQPMRQALEAMRQAGDPARPNPDAAALADLTERIQEQLEALKPRLEALARARQNLRNDPAEALAQLREELMQENAALASREIQELRDFLDRLMGQMKLLEGQENELARQTRDALPSLLPQIEAEQTNVEAEAQKLLAQAERLAEADRMLERQRRRRTPEFPDAPYLPEGEEMLIPPTEEDTEEPDSGEMNPAADEKAKADEKQDEEEEEMFMPPIGAKAKIDPRFAGKMRPVPKKKGDARQSQLDQAMRNDLRGQLTARQEQTAGELHDAQQQLRPRRDQLSDLMEQLRQALGLDSAEAAQELAELMQSMGMQRALEMAQAMRPSGQPAQPTAQQPAPQPSSAQIAQALMQSLSTQPNLAGNRVVGAIVDFEGNDIDLNGQTVILRMQPRLREELIKGMREEGPEGYRKFIQDYFNRLTKVKPQQ